MADIQQKYKPLRSEILQEVFEYLSFTDKLTCESVCKDWLKAALPCVNKSAELQSPIGVNLLLLNLTNSTQSDDMGYSGASVKKIKILIKDFADSNNNKGIEGKKILRAP